MDNTYSYGYQQNELLYALDIIHKFVHEDNNRIKMTPMREDLE